MKPKHTSFQIRFMDNDSNNDGFKVIKAGSIEDAEKLFNNLYPNCFILDIYPL